MNRTRVISAVAAALVVGVVAGNVVSGWAAAPKATTPSTSSTATAAPRAGLGLRLGSAMQAGGARLADVVAKLTGKDVAEVVALRTAGTSYAKIADGEGVSSDKVVDAAIDARKTILDEKVTAGTITAAQSAAALANMKTRLTERVTATDASCNGSGGGMGGGRGMGRGNGSGAGAGAGACGGSGCGVNPATATQ